MIVSSVGLNVYEYVTEGALDSAHLIAGTLYGIAGWWVGGQYDKAKFYSEKDALTKAYNRRFIDKVFPKIRSLMERQRKKLAVFIIDINDFKKINDTYGHKAGDQVLMHISNVLAQNTRKTDFIARWGGDEFLILAPDIGDNGDQIVLERIEAKLQDLPEHWNVGISVGVAIFPDEAASLDELIQVADQKMYGSKSYQKSSDPLPIQTS